jgi:hypothetical protein
MRCRGLDPKQRRNKSPEYFFKNMNGLHYIGLSFSWAIYSRNNNFLHGDVWDLRLVLPLSVLDVSAVEVLKMRRSNVLFFLSIKISLTLNHDIINLPRRHIVCFSLLVTYVNTVGRLEGRRNTQNCRFF